LSAIRFVTNETIGKRYGLLICLRVAALSHSFPFCLLRECDGLEEKETQREKKKRGVNWRYVGPFKIWDNEPVSVPTHPVRFRTLLVFVITVSVEMRVPLAPVYFCFLVQLPALCQLHRLCSFRCLTCDIRECACGGLMET